MILAHRKIDTRTYTLDPCSFFSSASFRCFSGTCAINVSFSVDMVRADVDTTDFCWNKATTKHSGLRLGNANKRIHSIERIHRKPSQEYTVHDSITRRRKPPGPSIQIFLTWRPALLNDRAADANMMI